MVAARHRLCTLLVPFAIALLSAAYSPTVLATAQPSGDESLEDAATEDAAGEESYYAPSWAGDASSEESAESSDLKALKDRVKTLEDMLQLMAESAPPAQSAPAAAPDSASSRPVAVSHLDIALILDFAFAYFSQESMQTGAHDPQETGFNFQQLEMSLTGNVDHVFTFAANLVFSQFGVEVEEAFMKTLSLPAGLQVRAGQFLTRMGRLNPTHPHSWNFVDQPLVNGTFLGSEGSRGLGAEISWLSPAPWYLEFYASATDAAGEANAKSFLGGNDFDIQGPEDFVYTVGAKQFFDFSPDVGMSWGLAAQLGPNATGNGNRTEIYATDLYLRWRPKASVDRMALSWTLETMLRRRQVPRDLRTDIGGYTQLVWNINPMWEVGARYGLVSGSPGDDLEPEATDYRHRASTQVTFYPSHFSRIRVQGTWDRPLYREEPIWAGFLSLEVLVGKHGAHKY